LLIGKIKTYFTIKFKTREITAVKRHLPATREEPLLTAAGEG